MFIKELIRLSTQNRTLYCYLILSVWIFLLIAGMCKYIGTTNSQAYLQLHHLSNNNNNNNNRIIIIGGDGDNGNIPGRGNLNSKKDLNNFLNINRKRDRLQHYLKDCMNIQDIVRKDEGIFEDSWQLQGVLVIMRHGDRGPMAHVKGINHIDCSIDDRDVNHLLNKYKIFLSNTTTTSPAAAAAAAAAAATSASFGPIDIVGNGGNGNGNIPIGLNGHPIWLKTGAFHGFPLLPTYQKSCLLGQLTYKGIAQLLYVGDLLRQIYGNQLGLFNQKKMMPQQQQQPNQSITTSTSTSSNGDQNDIIIYSTRYRRTFQSAMALLFTLLPIERWSTLTILESHSLSYCFADCACPYAEYLKNQLNKFNGKLLKEYSVSSENPHRSSTSSSSSSSSSIGNLLQLIGPTILQNPEQQTQPLDVRDAILSIICHKAPLPCRKYSTQQSIKNVHQSLSSAFYNAMNVKPVKTTSTTESIDFINIDENIDAGAHGNSISENFLNNNNNEEDRPRYENIKVSSINNVNHIRNINDDNNNILGDTDDDDADDGDRQCLNWNHIGAFLSYTNWQGKREAQHRYTKEQGLLRGYGILHNIVNYILKMISGDGVKFVLYSGHDRTIQFLSAALGLLSAKPFEYFIPYAGRLIFEIYKSDKDSHQQFYFRLLYNGNDITKFIDFCEGGKSLRINKDGRGNKADLCPIENIIRFVHDDYFSPMNATNFKDACTINK